MTTPARLSHFIRFNSLFLRSSLIVFPPCQILNIYFPSYLMFSFEDCVVRTNTTTRVLTVVLPVGSLRVP